MTTSSLGAAKTFVEKEFLQEHIEIGQYYRCVNPESTKFVFNNIYIITGIDENAITKEIHSIRFYIPFDECCNDEGYSRVIYSSFVDDFKFVPMEQADMERANRTLAIQSEMSAIQQDLSDSMMNARTLANNVLQCQDKTVQDEISKISVSKALPSPDQMRSDITTLISTSESNEKAVESLTNQTVLIKGIEAYSKVKQSELKGLVAVQKSFAMEKVYAFMGKSAELKSKIDFALDKISTLTIYAGSDVHVEVFMDGPCSTSKAPFYAFAEKIYMDQEMVTHNAFTEVSSFDFLRSKDFFQRLKDDKEFFDRVFPKERMFVVIQYTKAQRQYSDIFTSLHMNAVNMSTFMMIRDGDRVCKVTSPVEYQDRMYPTDSSMESIFNNITADSVKLTDAQRQFLKLESQFNKVCSLIQGILDRQITGHGQEVFGVLPHHEFQKSFLDPVYCTQNIHFMNDEDRLLGQGSIVEKPSEWINKNIDNITSISKGDSVICTIDYSSIEYSECPALFNSQGQRTWDLQESRVSGEVSLQEGQFYISVMATKYRERYSPDQPDTMEKKCNLLLRASSFINLSCLVPSELKQMIDSRSARPVVSYYMTLMYYAQVYVNTVTPDVTKLASVVDCDDFDTAYLFYHELKKGLPQTKFDALLKNNKALINEFSKYKESTFGVTPEEVQIALSSCSSTETPYGFYRSGNSTYFATLATEEFCSAFDVLGYTDSESKTEFALKLYELNKQSMSFTFSKWVGTSIKSMRLIKSLHKERNDTSSIVVNLDWVQSAAKVIESKQRNDVFNSLFEMTCKAIATESADEKMEIIKKVAEKAVTEASKTNDMQSGFLYYYNPVTLDYTYSTFNKSDVDVKAQYLIFSLAHAIKLVYRSISAVESKMYLMPLCKLLNEVSGLNVRNGMNFFTDNSERNMTFVFNLREPLKSNFNQATFYKKCMWYTQTGSFFIPEGYQAVDLTK